ncbi:AMP-binding protein [Victivallis sp. Marseille-Q1083]|uniref:AMP-binding protein n=1 Tax=Victivallis sp. Marseille-Q1083 TaxID=2717288 RepID=UPI00158F4A03|nr:AMP-binding protein [Victivallis sp. Marseille-Q1083]
MLTNIVELLFEQEQKQPDRPALLHRDRRITFRELADNVRRRAGYLRKRQLGAGDRILIFVPMSIELYEILLAVFQIGGTAVFLDAWADRRRMEQALEIAGCRGFIGIPKAFFLLLRSSRLRRVPLKLFSSFPGPKAADAAAGAATAATEPDEAALITFTTGSTGRPKAALRTHAFLLEQHRVLRRELALPAAAIDLATLPIFVLSNLAAGLTTLIPDFDPRRPGEIDGRQIAAEAARHQVTSTAGSPAFYDRLAAAADGSAIPSLRQIFLGGAAVFPNLAQRLIQAFPDAAIQIVYGSTEAEPIAAIAAREVAAASGERILRDGLPVGRVCDSIEPAVIPITAAPLPPFSEAEWEQFKLPPGETGEICVAGNHVLKQYLNSPEAMKQNKIAVGQRLFHRTGDAGRLDENGNLFLLGRAKTIFTLQDGRRCYPMPIEYLLQQLPGVTAGTILPIGGRAVLIVEPETDDEASRQAIAAQIGQLALPGEKLHFLKPIPRDPRHQSKFDYDRIAALCLPNAAAGPASR